jgi:large repetitive protein
MTEQEFGRAAPRPAARARRSLARFVVAASAVLAGSVGLVVAGAGEASAAAPTISVTPSPTSPGQYVMVSGANWPASTTAFVSVDGSDFCNPVSNASGTIAPVACGVPGVPAGTQNVNAEMNSGAQTATTTLKIVPAITYLPYSSFTKGTTFTLNSAGFAGGSVVHAYLDSTSSTALTTSPVTPTTDGSGNLNSLSVTLPGTVSAGAHSLILQDASSNSATRAITVYAPTFTIGGTTGGAGQPVNVSGSGFKPNDGVYEYLGATNFCSATTNSSGSFSTVCNLPGIPAGSHVTSAQQDSNNISVSGSSFTTTPNVTYFPDPAASPGATIRVDTEGLAASSNVTALLGTTVLATSPAHPTTDSSGNMTDLMVTLPSTAKTGSIIIKDASGNSAKTTVLVYKPKVKLSLTESPGSYFTVSGKSLWPSQALYLYIGTSEFCGLTANSAGTVNGYCSAPTIPAGTYAVSAQQDGGAISEPAGHLTIASAIEYLPNSVVTPGAVIRVDTYGLAAAAPVTAKLSGVSGNLTTNPASPVTSSSGAITSLMVTIPASAAVGSHTLTISDNAGNSATAAITVVTPTVSFTASSGAPGTSFTMTGSGWDPNYGAAYVSFGSNANECSGTVDSSGDLYGYCTVPSLAVGSYAITLQQDNGAVNVANGSFNIT